MTIEELLCHCPGAPSGARAAGRQRVCGAARARGALICVERPEVPLKRSRDESFHLATNLLILRGAQYGRFRTFSGCALPLGRSLTRVRPACEGTQRMPRSLSRAFMCAAFAPIDHRRSGPSARSASRSRSERSRWARSRRRCAKPRPGPQGLRRRRIRR